MKVTWLPYFADYRISQSKVGQKHVEAKSSSGLQSRVYSAFAQRRTVLTFLGKWKSAGFQHHLTVYSPWKDSAENEAEHPYGSSFLLFCCCCCFNREAYYMPLIKVYTLALEMVI